MRTSEPPYPKKVRVVLTIVADVEGDFLADGLGLAAGIANDVIGLPDGDWSPLSSPEVFIGVKFGKPWTVTVLRSDSVVAFVPEES